MFTIEYVQNDETQTIGYPSQAAALLAATSIWAKDYTTSLIITDLTDPQSPRVVEEWSRG